MSVLRNEKQTIAAMVRLFCAGQHSHALCAECAELLAYAQARLDRCPFGEHKPACVDCAVHCYKPAMRARVQHVMRFSGPRMLWRHPWLTLVHVASSFRGSRARTAARPRSR
jgi:hypothetical protein